MEITPNWIRTLLEAEGYLELGMFGESAGALASLSQEDLSRKEVLAFRVALHMTAKHWPAAAEIAACLVDLEPQESGWWVNLAYSVRRARTLDEAEAILVRAVELHSEVAIIHYNLACYACVTNRLDLAKERFTRARALDSSVREMALADADLFALRDWIRSGC